MRKQREREHRAVFLCKWILSVSQGIAQRVEQIVYADLPDIEGHANMEGKICRAHCNLFGGFF